MATTQVYTYSEHSYLSVTLDSKLSQSSHINKTTTKANRTLNFLKRNLSKRSSSVKESAYLALARPSSEYTSVVWDPYHNNKLSSQKKYSEEQLDGSSIISAITAFLQQCCNIFNGQPYNYIGKYRLQTLFRIIHQKYQLSIPSYFQLLTSMKRSTKLYHPRMFYFTKFIYICTPKQFLSENIDELE